MGGLTLSNVTGRFTEECAKRMEVNMDSRPHMASRRLFARTRRYGCGFAVDLSLMQRYSSLRDRNCLPSRAVGITVITWQRFYNRTLTLTGVLANPGISLPNGYCRVFSPPPIIEVEPEPLGFHGKHNIQPVLTVAASLEPRANARRHSDQ